MEQVSQGKLVDAVETTVFALVCRRHNAMFGRQPLRLPPQRRHFNLVDAVAPRIPLGQHRFVEPVGELHLVQFTSGQFAHFTQGRFDFGQYGRRQRPPQIGAQHAVVVVLIAQTGR